MTYSFENANLVITVFDIGQYFSGEIHSFCQKFRVTDRLAFASFSFERYEVLLVKDIYVTS